jgi:uncharacterized protein (DUF58 family)
VSRSRPHPIETGADATSRVRWHTDPRVPAYLLSGFGGLGVAIATGQYEWAAMGTALLVVVALGLIGRKPGGATGRVVLDTLRVIEQDEIPGEICVDWDGVAEVDVLLAGQRGVAPVDPPDLTGWTLPAGVGPVNLSFRLRARSWGAHEPGTLWVRLRRPGGLRVAELTVAMGPRIRVLPAALRIDAMLRPDEPRAVSGIHVSSLRGQGTDFAELRPYQAGDRLRDISWGASARLGVPWVKVHHPERTATVLLLLDAFTGEGPLGVETLARAARASWAVAEVHLRAQDRVGILAQGRAAAWVPPRGGRRAQWLLLDELLAVGGAAVERERRPYEGGRIVIPPDALIVGVTALRYPTFVRELLHHRRVGHRTVALVIDPSDIVPPPDSTTAMAALRLWNGQRDAERDRLERSGVATALVSAESGVGPAISALRRRTRGSGGRPYTRGVG